MTYNFDTTVDRRRSGSFKWDIMTAALGDASENGLAVSTADMDFVPIPEIVEAIQETATQPIYGYTGPTDEYFDAVMSWMKRRHGWMVARESIVTSPGIVASLYYVLHAFTQPGDGVIIQTPVYRPFSGSITATRRKVIANPLVNENGNYRIDFDELERIADICTTNSVLVVSDEIHNDIVFPPHRHTVYATLPERLTRNCIVCTSPSKTFNLSGLQVSNIFIPDPAIRKRFTDAAHSCGFHALNSFAYSATIAAYERCENWLEQMLKYVQGNDEFVRKFMGRHMPELSVTPLEGTYLQWIDFSAWKWDHLEREKRLREQAKVYFESGHIFGDEGRAFERFNLAYPRSVIEDVLQRVMAVR